MLPTVPQWGRAFVPLRGRRQESSARIPKSFTNFSWMGLPDAFVRAEVPDGQHRRRQAAGDGEQEEERSGPDCHGRSYSWRMRAVELRLMIPPVRVKPKAIRRRRNVKRYGIWTCTAVRSPRLVA